MKVALIYHKELKNYDFGRAHSFRGDRFELFLNFFEHRFARFKNQFQILQAQPATDEILQLIHTKDYIEAIRGASEGKTSYQALGYVSEDNLNPLTGRIPSGIERAARVIVGVSVKACDLVAEGRSGKAIGIGGGMHHAKPSFGEGFCFYNDVAISVQRLKQRYKLSRILVLDTDAHAGNGTQEIFYDDPSVLFIDIHQDPRTIYPGTGFIEEIGARAGAGFNVNLPLLPGASSDAYQYLFEEVVFPLAREFKPQALIRYGGSDPHYLDKLTTLGLTIEGFKMIGRLVREIAQEVCDGKSIDLVTSGYNLEVLPFCWSALISGLLDLEVDLRGVKELASPPTDYRLEETKEMVQELKKILKSYWRCMAK
jgi:acetoin utilization protein AcuC